MNALPRSTSGLRKGIVVDTHPEDHSVDLIMCDDGSRFTGVPVLAGNASARSGSIDLPEVKKTGDKWNITQRDGQDMEVYVGFMGSGNPVVIGFVYPQISQMTFKDKTRRFNRHQSDVYHTIDGSGNMELYHPSGAYIRVAENPDHEDLEKKNFDENLAIDRNKDKKPCLRVKLGGFQLDVDKDGNVTMKAPKVKIDSSVEVTGDVIASGISLKGHHHSGVKSGGDTSGPPIGGGGSSGSGGGTGGGSGAGDNFQPTKDAYGNAVQYDGNGNYYVQSMEPYTIDSPAGPVTGYRPTGERIYTDASGNVQPQVTISGANSLVLGSDGVLRQSPDTVITQTVPTGDPLPDNPGKVP